MVQRLRVTREPGLATIVFARPEVHNAFDEHLIAELTSMLEALALEDGVEAVIITGDGRSFSAGADLDWMKRSAGYGEEENLADARRLAHLLRTLDELPVVTIARVNGAALGGGVGLVAACDIAIAAGEARFGLSEVRLGLVPAVIAPYVVRAMGERAARRYSLSGERFDAVEALRVGLVHEVVDGQRLDARIAELVGELSKGGRDAKRCCKSLLIAMRQPSDDIDEMTARLIATRRSSREAREGVSAFLEKRAPVWGS